LPLQSKEITRPKTTTSERNRQLSTILIPPRQADLLAIPRARKTSQFNTLMIRMTVVLLVNWRQVETVYDLLGAQQNVVLCDHCLGPLKHFLIFMMIMIGSQETIGIDIDLDAYLAGW
jgi:hypothetical protein